MSSGLVDYGRLLDILGSEGRLLAAATQDASPAAHIAGASGLTLLETVRHIGDRCEDCLSWLGAAESAASHWHVSAHADLPELTGRFTERLAELLARFGTSSPQEPAPTWYPEDHTISFWLRRMVHATTLHRLDVQTAACADLTPISADVACDGIDEVLRLWFGYRLAALGMYASRPLSVRVVAESKQWHVRADTERVRAGQQPDSDEPDTDATISGDAPSVYLWLWGRLPDRAITVTGDHDAIAQLWGLLRLATQ